MTKQVKSRFSSPGGVQQWHLQTKHVNDSPCFGEGWEGNWGFGEGNKTEFAVTVLWSLCWINKQKIHHLPQTSSDTPRQLFPLGSLNFGSQWMDKHVNLSHQTSRQPVHLYNELPLGCLHLVLVFNHCLWKDGNNLICPAPPQLILWGRASLLLHVGDSYSESFLNVRPKEDPASLNWICRPPLTSSYASDPNKQLTNSQTFWAGGLGTGALPVFLYCVCSGWFWTGAMWNYFGGRRQREGYGGGEGNVAAITAFSFSSSPEFELYRQATVGPWIFLAPSYSLHWKPLRSYVNITCAAGFWACRQWLDPALVEPLLKQITHN